MTPLPMELIVALSQLEPEGSVSSEVLNELLRNQTHRNLAASGRQSKRNSRARSCLFQIVEHSKYQTLRADTVSRPARLDCQKEGKKGLPERIVRRHGQIG